MVVHWTENDWECLLKFLHEFTSCLKGKNKTRLFYSKIYKKYILYNHVAKIQHISKILSGFWYHRVKKVRMRMWDLGLVAHWVTSSHWEADNKPDSTSLEERNEWSSLLGRYTWRLFTEIKMLVKDPVHPDRAKPVLGDASSWWRGVKAAFADAIPLGTPLILESFMNPKMSYLGEKTNCSIFKLLLYLN